MALIVVHGGDAVSKLAKYLRFRACSALSPAIGGKNDRQAQGNDNGIALHD